MSGENSIPKKDRCHACDGDGFITHHGLFGSSSHRCQFCDGSGYSAKARADGGGR